MGDTHNSAGQDVLATRPEATPAPNTSLEKATPAKRRIAVGITGKPSKLCVSLFDVANNYSSGVDLYFRDVADVLETLKAITEKVEADKEWFIGQLTPKPSAGGQ